MSLIEFHGPYVWFATKSIPSILDSPQGKGKGIYLWTVPGESGELVYYVGETGRSFSSRFKEHLSAQLCGMYHIYDPEVFQLGRKVMLWPGQYDKDHRGNLNEFVRKLPSLAEPLQKFIYALHFFVAEVDADSRFRRRIEGAIADHLRKQPGTVGTFQDQGIRYQRRRISEPLVQMQLSSSVAIQGLPEALEV